MSKKSQNHRQANTLVETRPQAPESAADAGWDSGDTQDVIANSRRRAREILEPRGSKEKPLLLLNIDVLLNPVPAGPDPTYREHAVGWFTVQVHGDAEAMVAELKLHYDVAWFSSRYADAAPLVGPLLGLHETDALPATWEFDGAILPWEDACGGRAQAPQDWVPLLPELLGINRRWVWIDDMQPGMEQAWFQRQRFARNGFRLIRTDEGVGLSWDDVADAVDQARIWSRRRARGEAA